MPQQELYGLDGQPQVYPAPVFVKNTFIDIGTGRPLSLDGFFEERRVLSCPTSCVEDPQWDASTGDTADRSGALRLPGAGEQSLRQGEAAVAVGAATQAAAAVGQLPSMGSAGHSIGECKPCVFLHTRGCKSGLDCTFCHLCEVGEKKRRQKDKRSFFAQVRQHLQPHTQQDTPGPWQH
eukprot:CAMPEP_0183437694 /NCGR_PEP_ID=MMETSP0370-20130417/74208_1 /TAXON_ID=268820 /ORGANISM="Peridinium aciculiferum, Strain PAER-2" /LENGTH=178 /DNA_ID=CAMNT_0025625593 /DNA_START=12 /DNA_END=548 /DNA_ORIENTATION=-